MKKDPHEQREAKKYENPIPSREFILDCLAKIGRPASAKNIASSLGLETPLDRDALSKRLGAMVRAGQLVVDRRNVYAIASKVDLIKGRVSAHPDGYGFLLVEDDEDIFFTYRQMRQVFHGDVVMARIRSKNRQGKTEGEIVEVVERNTQQLVGRYYIENDIKLLEPLNKRINHEVILQAEGNESCSPGQIVVAEITQQPGPRGVVMAKVVEVLGDHLTPGIEVDIALRNNDIPSEWDDDIQALVDAMPSQVTAADKKGRFDLTELPFVTIDGEDARDFDDAVYCEPNESGGWRLYVAIADVAHYVKTASPLDDAARERATSVYFPQYVVPMLPEKLSNGLCSLKPKVERLVLVCEMIISSQGLVTGFQFYDGVIFSHARLTYTEVAKAIHGDDNEPARIAMGDLAENIDELDSLYAALVRQRKSRGAIEFDSPELQFQFSPEGRVQSIVPRARNKAHRIIEECMLCANVCAAKLVNHQDRPGLFRVHEPPTPEKLTALEEFLDGFGIRFKAGDNVQPADYQQIVRQLQGQKNGHVLQMALLRSMNQAVYQIENKGHFGLGYDEYTHFTSPIRRYPDLLTHRLIKSEIYSAIDEKHTLRLGRKRKTDFYPYSLAQMLELGEFTSFAERRADSAVYEVLEYLKCDYISDRVGDIFSGVVTGVAKFGLFVQLDDIYVEGLIHVSTLVGDYYHYDQGTQVLSGERTGTTYGMGDVVEAQIVRVNVDERKVDFELVSHTSLGTRKTGQKKKRAKPKANAAGKPQPKSVSKSQPKSQSKASSAQSADTKPKPKSSGRRRRRR
ncbi:MAG: ribonuclease R [Candidatus Azotimanducaceae bacterium]